MLAPLRPAKVVPPTVAQPPSRPLPGRLSTTMPLALVWAPAGSVKLTTEPGTRAISPR